MTPTYQKYKLGWLSFEIPVNVLEEISHKLLNAQA